MLTTRNSVSSGYHYYSSVYLSSGYDHPGQMHPLRKGVSGDSTVLVLGPVLVVLASKALNVPALFWLMLLFCDQMNFIAMASRLGALISLRPFNWHISCS